MMELRSLIRDIPDFPKKGIIFKDITTLLKDASAFKETIQQLCKPYRDTVIHHVVGIESRGFIFGSAMALELETGFIPVRKPGKLPAAVEKEEYSLEYGTDSIEIHQDAINPEEKVLIVDDLLATGGTAAATARLVKRTGGDIVGAAFLIKLSFLNGRKKLGGVPIHVLIDYSGD